MTDHGRRSRRSAVWLAISVVAVSATTVTMTLTVASAAPTATGTASSAATNCGNCQGNSGNGGGNGGTAGGSTPPPKALTATAVLTGLIAPGVTASLAVRVQNPNAQAVVLKSVTGTVTAVTSGNRPLPACSKAWVAIAPFAGARTIARDGETTVPLTVSFVNLATVNQDNCKGATYTFSFSAAADRA